MSFYGTGPRPSSDKYRSFAELCRSEVEGVDFRIEVRSGFSGIAVMAPHGGNIEPGTTEIASALASEEHTFYSFEGLKCCANHNLHLTSSRFDEPIGARVVEESTTAVTIHGCKGKEEVVYVGGLDEDLRREMKRALVRAGFTVAERAGMQGKDPRNLCNRNRKARGVQLEISAGLRRTFFENLTGPGRQKRTERFDRFVAALREVLWAASSPDAGGGMEKSRNA